MTNLVSSTLPSYVSNKVRDVLKGTSLVHFLDLYQQGARGLVLYNLLRRNLRGLGLDQRQASQVYQVYRQIAESGQNLMSQEPKSTLQTDQIATDPYKTNLDRVLDRYQYFVKLELKVEGEESVYYPTVTVTSDVPLSLAEIVDDLPEDLGGSPIFDQSGRPVTLGGGGLVVLSAEVIGAVKLY